MEGEPGREVRRAGAAGVPGERLEPAVDLIAAEQQAAGVFVQLLDQALEGDVGDGESETRGFAGRRAGPLLPALLRVLPRRLGFLEFGEPPPVVAFEPIVDVLGRVFRRQAVRRRFLRAALGDHDRPEVGRLVPARPDEHAAGRADRGRHGGQRGQDDERGVAPDRGRAFNRQGTQCRRQQIDRERFVRRDRLQLAAFGGVRALLAVAIPVKAVED